MAAPDTQFPTPFAARTLAWWNRRGSVVLLWAGVIMAAVAMAWLSYEVWRLLWQPPPGSTPQPSVKNVGARDLLERFTETRALFAGKAVYQVVGTASYPPASMTMLWPILGWPAFSTARWLWAVLTAVMLVWTARMVMRESGATTGAERRLAMLLPLAMYSTGAATGNGQLCVPVVACLIASLPVLLREDRAWPSALAVLGFVAALVKPSLAAPFFWMVLFRPKRWLWPMAIVAIYLGLTAVPALVQPVSAVQLSHEFVSRTGIAAAWGAANHGHANLHSWLGAIGQPAWDTKGSLVVLGLLGVWTWRHRRADPWLLMSAAAFAARFWTYHGWYDDLLLLIPMIALFRLAKQSPSDRQKLWAGSLLAAMVCSTLAPGGLYLPLPAALTKAYLAIQVVIWATAFVFLLRAARSTAATISSPRCVV
jgi:hypothetical protein